MKRQNTHWRRYLNSYQRKILKEDFQDILKISRGGMLTTHMRKRLLGIKKQTKDDEEVKLWSNIRDSVKTTFIDLQLIMRVASDKQLSQMFESEYKESFPDYKIKHTRLELEKFLRTLFREFENNQDPAWQDKLARSIVEIGIVYFRSKPEFQGTLHQRLFSDVMDTLYINNSRDSELSGLI